MAKEQLRDLFKNYDSSIQAVILGVLAVEQEHISMIKPRGIMEEIEVVINAVANKKIEWEDRKATK